MAKDIDIGTLKSILPRDHLIFTDFEGGVSGLLTATYATNPNTSKHWKEQGAIDAICRHPEYVGVDNMKQAANEMPDILMDKIRSHTDTLVSSWSVTYDSDNHKPSILLHPLGQIDDRDLKDKHLKTKLHKYSIEYTLRNIADQLSDSNLTEREFLSYHLSVTLTDNEIAAALSTIFETTQKEETVRKYQSRTRNEIKAAKHTINITEIDEEGSIEDLETLSSYPNSPISNELKNDIYAALYKDMHLSNGQPNLTSKWEIQKGWTISIEMADHSMTITLQIPFSDIDISSPIYVTEAIIDHPNIIEDKHDIQTLSLDHLSESTHKMKMELRDIIEAVTDVPITYNTQDQFKAVQAHLQSDIPTITFVAEYPINSETLK